MKKLLTALLAAGMLLSLCACGQETEPIDEPPQEITLSLWVYPTKWLEPEALEAFLAAFTQGTQEPVCHVDVTYLEPETADATVRGAMESRMMPDLLLGNVKPLVTQFAREGMMAPLTDLCSGRGIYGKVLDACTGEDGGVYLAPLFINPYCMAFNPYLFEDAGTLKFADTQNHTWNTSEFFDAEIAMFSYGTTDFASLYCYGQNGDYATRAFVTNLYGGGLVNPDGTYTVSNEQNLKAFKKLVRYKGFRWDNTMLAEDASYLFSRGEYAATLCWSADMAREYETKFPVIPMSFPTKEGVMADLPGEVWGLSVFDCGNEHRLTAARRFISYLYGDAGGYAEFVKLSGYFSAREGFTLYADDETLAPYELLSAYIAPEPQDTENWLQMRTAWCELLATIADTEDITESGIKEAMAAFDLAANQK